jgi:hypothetical protein
VPIAPHDAALWDSVEGVIAALAAPTASKLFTAMRET